MSEAAVHDLRVRLGDALDTIAYLERERDDLLGALYRIAAGKMPSDQVAGEKHEGIMCAGRLVHIALDTLKPYHAREAIRAKLAAAQREAK